MEETQAKKPRYARSIKFSPANLRKINEFSRKWRWKFFEHHQDAASAVFSEECRALGFKNDSGASLKKEFPDIAVEDAEGIIQILPEIENINLLGTALYSYWYWKHNQFRGAVFTAETQAWLLPVLERMITLSDAGAVDAVIEKYRIDPDKNTSKDEWFKNVYLEDVLTFPERGEKASPLHTDQPVLLIHEPDEKSNPCNFRVETIFPPGQKIGYIPHDTAAKILEAPIPGFYHVGRITSLDENARKIIINIAERENLPIDNITSITLREFSDLLQWETTTTLYFRQKKFIHRDKSRCGTSVVELQFSDKYWKTYAYPELQSCNFLSWQEDMDDAAESNTVTWELTLRCKGGKVLTTCGGYPFPIEWERMQGFFRECLNLDCIKGNGRFYIEDWRDSSKS